MDQQTNKKGIKKGNNQKTNEQIQTNEQTCRPQVKQITN